MAQDSQGLDQASWGLTWTPLGLAKASLGLVWASLGLAQVALMFCTPYRQNIRLTVYIFTQVHGVCV